MSIDMVIIFDFRFMHLVAVHCSVGLNSSWIHCIIISSVVYRSRFITRKYAFQGQITIDVLFPYN